MAIKHSPGCGCCDCETCFLNLFNTASEFIAYDSDFSVDPHVLGSGRISWEGIAKGNRQCTSDAYMLEATLKGVVTFEVEGISIEVDCVNGDLNIDDATRSFDANTSEVTDLQIIVTEDWMLIAAWTDGGSAVLLEDTHTFANDYSIEIDTDEAGEIGEVAYSSYEVTLNGSGEIVTDCRRSWLAPCTKAFRDDVSYSPPSTSVTLDFVVSGPDVGKPAVSVPQPAGVTWSSDCNVGKVDTHYSLSLQVQVDFGSPTIATPYPEPEWAISAEYQRTSFYNPNGLVNCDFVSDATAGASVAINDIELGVTLTGTGSVTTYIESVDQVIVGGDCSDHSDEWPVSNAAYSFVCNLF